MNCHSSSDYYPGLASLVLEAPMVVRSKCSGLPAVSQMNPTYHLVALAGPILLATESVLYCFLICYFLAPHVHRPHPTAI